MACTTRRRHHHVTVDLHHPRGFSPPRWLPSVQTRACCSSAGQDSFPFTPSSSRCTSVSTGLGRACDHSQLPAFDRWFTRQRSKVRAHPPKNPTRDTRLTHHARHPRCYQRFCRAHCIRSLLAVGPTSVSGCLPSTSRSSSFLGTVLRSDVAIGFTKHSPSMGSLVARAFQLLLPPPRLAASPPHVPTSGAASSRLPLRQHAPRGVHAASAAVCLATVSSIHRSVSTDLHGVF